MLNKLAEWQKESQNEARRVRKTRKHSTVTGHWRHYGTNRVWIEEHDRCAHVAVTTKVA